MTRLLVVVASPQFDYSISRQLTKRFVAEWRRAHPDGDVVTRDLITAGAPLVDIHWIIGAFTAPDTHSAESAAAMRLSDELIAELQAADHILIGTPMHNLTIPAPLKAWIDQIVRVGSTVTPTNEGLVRGKKAAIIIASGGDFSPGAPGEQYNHASPYLRAILGLIGISDIQFILAGPTRPIAMGDIPAEDLLTRFEPAVADIVRSWQ
ncbi:NAD(P)H-dependent oxidoreductase [Sphingomonas sp.]|uniref:FMN-dependent NADH-azoreductase n=1 Tax=Sphingomonas sp. TaxID=28214 RepID=UPI0025DC8347|nr:NAD(P)H-dependent oxidoreductase [Sphingomonas sp.]